jgi:ankyrin repeat protein
MELIPAGADVNKATNNRNTALLVVAAKGNILGIKLLIKAGSNINHVTRYGWTALLLAAACCADPGAARCSNTECLVTLIAAGCSVGATNSNGDTVLTYAARHADQENFRMLVAAGADTTRPLPVNTHPDLLGDDRDEGFRQLIQEEKVNLMNLCRVRICDLLNSVDPQKHLFGKVPQLPLPELLQNFLLYNVTLEGDFATEV